MSTEHNLTTIADLERAIAAIKQLQQQRAHTAAFLAMQNDPKAILNGRLTLRGLAGTPSIEVKITSKLLECIQEEHEEIEAKIREATAITGLPTQPPVNIHGLPVNS